MFSSRGATDARGPSRSRSNPTTGEVGFTASEANGEIEYSYTVRAENALGEGRRGDDHGRRGLAPGQSRFSS